MPAAGIAIDVIGIGSGVTLSAQKSTADTTDLESSMRARSTGDGRRL
jgi:hypothetical protein